MVAGESVGVNSQPLAVARSMPDSPCSLTARGSPEPGGS
jgi:hypothetical protein